jgi:hypothetical protein
VIEFLNNEIWLNDEFEKMLTDNSQIIKPDFRVHICNEYISKKKPVAFLKFIRKNKFLPVSFPIIG